MRAGLPFATVLSLLADEAAVPGARLDEEPAPGELSAFDHSSPWPRILFTIWQTVEGCGASA